MKLYKMFWYGGLSGIKAFMSSFMIILAFFVERFFIAKYVDYNLAEGIIPIVNEISKIWRWIFLVLLIFFWIIAYRELVKSEIKKDAKGQSSAPTKEIK